MTGDPPPPAADAGAGRRRLGLGLVIAALILAADQASKWLILTVVMAPPRVIPVTDFFNLVLTWNRGISFSLLAGEAVWLPLALVALALVICGFLIVWMRRAENALIAAALGLVVGGALGNVVDRLRFGAVIDFLDLHVGGWHWPAFNLADSAISVGVAVILIHGLWLRPGVGYSSTGSANGDRQQARGTQTDDRVET